jgi:ATP-dependent Clp protease ATP-binding subunit ClpX
MSALARARAPKCASPSSLTRHRPAAYSTFLAVAPRRSQYFNSGFTSSYDPSHDTGRGPIFAKSTFGVPQFYPRDLKRRVDDYVVGQERAKKTICSVIFNHYQGLRRRQHHDVQDQRLREKLQRQKFAQDRDLPDRVSYGGDRIHPVEGGRWSFDNPAVSRSRRQADQGRYSIEDEFPGHNESVRVTHLPTEDTLTASSSNFYVPEDSAVPQHVKIDKSNLLLIGPTGVGKTYILE